MHIIRIARSADAYAVESLYRELVDDKNVRVAQTQVHALESDPRPWLLVCEVDGHVRGTVLIGLCMDAMYASQPFAVVENFVAQRDFRGTASGGVATGSGKVLPGVRLLEDDLQFGDSR